MCYKISTCSHDRLFFLLYNVKHTHISHGLNLCFQVVSSRLQMTETLLQKISEEQGASEAIENKLVNKAVSFMDSMGALVDR